MNKQPKPYVYIGIKYQEQEIKGIYIGVRSKNVKLGLMADQDLGVKYFTSSKNIQPIFHEMVWEVLKEFDTISEAYEFEKDLISDYIKSGLLLNQSIPGGEKFYTGGRPHTEESKAKLSAIVTEAWKNKTPEEKARRSAKISASNIELWSNMSPEERAQRGAVHKGKTLSKEHKQKIKRTKNAKTTEEKAMISEKLRTAHQNRSPEEKARLSKNLSEIKKGKKLSDSQKAKLSAIVTESWKNKTPDELAKRSAKYSETCRNRSPEKKAEISAKKSASLKGRLISEEHKRKISEALTKRWAIRKSDNDSF